VISFKVIKEKKSTVVARRCTFTMVLVMDFYLNIQIGCKDL